MTATLASFGTALFLRTVSGQSVSLVILAVVLVTEPVAPTRHDGWRPELVTLVMVPVVGISAVTMGQLLQQHFAAGAVVLTLAIGVSFLLRQLPWWMALAGRLLLLPATAILVVPAVGLRTVPGVAGGWRQWRCWLLRWVAVVRRLATWIRLQVPPAVHLARPRPRSVAALGPDPDGPVDVPFPHPGVCDREDILPGPLELDRLDRDHRVRWWSQPGRSRPQGS